MRVLGLDLSKRCAGFAVWGPEDERPHSGFWELGSEFTPRGRVFAKLHQNMSDLHQLGKIDAIFYERPLQVGSEGHTNADTLNLLIGLAMHAESWGEAMGCRIIKDVHQATWRRLFLGKLPRGMQSTDLKDMAMKQARRMGFRPIKHDQAEAIGIMDFGCEQLGLSPPWRAQSGMLAQMAGA